MKKLLLTTALAAATFAAYAGGPEVAPAPMPTMSGPYLGGSIGWGDLVDATSDGRFTGPVSSLIKVNNQSGGVSGRVYTGYLFNVGHSNFYLGPEVGASFYYPSKASIGNGGLANSILGVIGESNAQDLANEEDVDGKLAPDSTGSLQASVKSWGWGIDFLANATYYFWDRLGIFVKPGFQLAFEQIQPSLNVDATINTYSQPDPDEEPTINTTSFGYNPTSTFNNTGVRPEVIVGALWKLSPSVPFSIGVSYQYVWGNNDRGLVYQNFDRQISDRQMVSFDMQYNFTT